MVIYIQVLDDNKEIMNPSTSGLEFAKNLAKVYTEKQMDVVMGGRDLRDELWRLKIMDKLNGLPDELKDYEDGILYHKLPYYKIQECIDTKFMELYQGLSEGKKEMPHIPSEEMEADLPKYSEGVLKSYGDGRTGASLIVVNDQYLFMSSHYF
ncbi:MAG: hypothetical protein KAT28_01740 [Candidatus Aenigmarchaeota archaeon]|nr:hypothetical protein [Candidatus Aenigmarchaeota archaeon]